MKVAVFALLVATCCVLGTQARVAQNIEDLRNVTLTDVIEDVVEIVEEMFDELDIAGCRVQIRYDLADPQPLFLVPYLNQFWPINNQGQAIIDSGEFIEFACTSNFQSPFGSTKTIVAKCLSGQKFLYAGKEYNMNKFTCQQWPSYSARKINRACNGGTIIESGFTLSANRFIKQMEECFDEKVEATRYVYHTMGAGNDYYQTAVPRVTFATAGFFGGKNVDNLYTQKKQKETINRALGGVADQYFDEKKSFFLARGHLGAKADFVYGTQQRGTFLFLNAAPQWQRFNAGNWQRVEDSVRALASKRQTHFDCYTGTWGVTTLPNWQNKDTELFLFYDQKNQGQIPVPKLYYRVVYEPSTKKGIVLIGVNNPHLNMAKIRSEYIICPDVSDKINYVNWKKTDIASGYSYACEVKDFRRVVDYFPYMEVTGLLV